MSLSKSFIALTGQATKLYGGIACFLAIGAVVGVLMFFTSLSDVLVIVTVAAVMAALALGTWLCLAIKCPNCRARVVWLAMRHHSAEHWFWWLMNLTRCPRCGFMPR